MALAADGTDPCGLLNQIGIGSNLWLGTLPTATYTGTTLTSNSLVSAPGVLQTFGGLIGATGADLSINVLSAAGASSTSSARLVKFLKVNGVLSNVLLKNSTYKSIVDNYFIGSGASPLTAASYTYSTSSSTLLTDNILSSVRDKLLADAYLLTQEQIFKISDFGTTSPAAGSESLVYLYNLQQSSQTALTAGQTARLNDLESKNLRFFGAFLCEYCFYKTRYDLLLSNFFTTYASTNPYVGQSPNSFIGSLSTGSGPATDNLKYAPDANGKITQSDYLKILGYHLACLNTRLTDMRRLLASINTYYSSVFTNLQTAINDQVTIGSTTKLQNTISALQASANDASGYLAQTDFNKAAMEYNSEKNRYANILLGLYAFLNIAALATVFQLARTS
jgi:hypothetical protein